MRNKYFFKTCQMKCVPHRMNKVVQSSLPALCPDLGMNPWLQNQGTRNACVLSQPQFHKRHYSSPGVPNLTSFLTIVKNSCVCLGQLSAEPKFLWTTLEPITRFLSYYIIKTRHDIICAVNFYNAGVVTQGRRIGSWWSSGIGRFFLQRSKLGGEIESCQVMRSIYASRLETTNFGVTSRDVTRRHAKHRQDWF
jgi:hypothetical protein